MEHNFFSFEQWFAENEDELRAQYLIDTYDEEQAEFYELEDFVIDKYNEYVEDKITS